MTEKVPLKIVKPSFLEKFKSKRPPSISGVETLLTALPLCRSPTRTIGPPASVGRGLLVAASCALCPSRSRARSATCCT